LAHCATALYLHDLPKTAFETLANPQSGIRRFGLLTSKKPFLAGKLVFNGLLLIWGAFKK
jgi:hypothetical protein